MNKTIIIFALLILIGGIFYLNKKNNWGCALDGQGTKFYILKSDLNAYKDKIENYDGSQYTNDLNMINKLKNESVVYAEDSNNCYGKHVYKIKNDEQLITVNLDSFNEYLSGEKFNRNLCENGTLVEQSGNSPFFIKYNFCRI